MMNFQVDVEEEIDTLYREIKNKSQHFNELYSSLGLSSRSTASPMVDKLIKGMAQHTSNLKQYVDYKYEEFSRKIAKYHVPCLVSPFPSVGVFQFSLKESNYLECQSIPKKTLLKCQTKEVPYHFTTLANIEIYPTINLTMKLYHDSVILNLDIKKQTARTSGDFVFPFFLAGETRDNLQIREWLLSKIKKVVCNGDELCINNKPLMIHPLDVESVSAMMSVNHPPQSAMSLLNDYSWFPEQYFFLAIHLSSDIVNNLKPGKYRIKLEFQEKWLCNLHPKEFEKNVVFSCVPAVNYYNLLSEPTRFCSNQSEYEIDIKADNHFLSIGVKEIVGVSSDFDEEVFSDINGINHKGPHGFSFDIHYARENSKCLISFENINVSNDFECFTVELFGCNKLYGDSLVGENHCSGDIGLTSFSNVRRLSATAWPKRDVRQIYEAIFFANIDVSLLSNFEYLIKWMSCFMPYEKSTNKIEAIKEVNNVMENKIHKGEFIFVNHFDFHVNEGGFLNRQDVRLFFMVVYCAIKNMLPVNMCLSFAVVEVVSKELIFKTDNYQYE